MRPTLVLPSLVLFDKGCAELHSKSNAKLMQILLYPWQAVGLFPASGVSQPGFSYIELKGSSRFHKNAALLSVGHPSSSESIQRFSDLHTAFDGSLSQHCRASCRLHAIVPKLEPVIAWNDLASIAQ